MGARAEARSLNFSSASNEDRTVFLFDLDEKLLDVVERRQPDVSIRENAADPSRGSGSGRSSVHHRAAPYDFFQDTDML